MIIHHCSLGHVSANIHVANDVSKMKMLIRMRLKNRFTVTFFRSRSFGKDKISFRYKGYRSTRSCHPFYDESISITVDCAESI